MNDQDDLQSQSIVRVDGLGKQYANGVWGVKDINFELPEGAMVALLGPNGSGKTTLIQLLVGALRPTEGSVEFSGESPARIGWSGQELSLDWFINCISNVEFGARLAGVSRSAARSRSMESLAAVSLGDYAFRQPDELSGGQQQRLQIARALAGDPELLVLDEPTSGLDIDSSVEVMTYIRELVSRDGKTALVSSHDLDLLQMNADFVVFLSQGEVVAFEDAGAFKGRLDGRTFFEIQMDFDSDVHLDLLDQSPLVFRSSIAGKVLTMETSEETSAADVVALVEEFGRINSVRAREANFRDVYRTLRSGGA